MLNFKFAFLIIGLIACLGTFTVTAKYKDYYYNNLINKEKVEAAVSLYEANLKTLELERQYQQITQSLELQHAEKQTQLDKIYADNKRLARELGGLRDPGKSENCASELSATANPSGILNETYQGAKLSEAATEFLLAFARDADEAENQRNLCQEWVRKTR